jgi:hypothetical protein
MSSYRMDKIPFNAKQAAEAAKGNAAYYKTLTWQERLLVANYLNSIKYNYPENEPPRLDRTYFKAWSMEQRNKEE